MDNDHIPSNVWDGITYPFPNFTNFTVGILRMAYFRPIFHNGCDHSSKLGFKLNHLCKRGPWCGHASLHYQVFSRYVSDLTTVYIHVGVFFSWWVLSNNGSLTCSFSNINVLTVSFDLTFWSHIFIHSRMIDRLWYLNRNITFLCAQYCFIQRQRFRRTVKNNTRLENILSPMWKGHCHKNSSICNAICEIYYCYCGAIAIHYIHITKYMHNTSKSEHYAGTPKLRLETTIIKHR